MHPKSRLSCDEEGSRAVVRLRAGAAGRLIASRAGLVGLVPVDALFDVQRLPALRPHTAKAHIFLL